jgi:hypothetical protein
MDVKGFMVEHQACQYGHDFVNDKGITSKSQAYTEGDLIVLMFLFAKDQPPQPDVLFQYAYALADRGDTSEDRRMLRYEVTEAIKRANDSAEWHNRLNNKLLDSRRRRTAKLTVPRLRVEYARRITFFIADYLHQSKFGQFHVPYSYALAETFRSFFPNPYE